jgi:hypothetical protein
MKKNYSLINKDYSRIIIKEITTNGNTQFFEISSEINHDSLKIEKINYRLLRNESDSLANWQGRDQSAWYVSNDSIIAAEKMLKKNLSQLKKDLSEALTHPAYFNMSQVVNDMVNHYKADFFFHDALQLSKHDSSIKFIWIARDCGTWLFYSQNNWSNEIFNSLKKSNENRQFFFWDGKNLNTVSLEQAQSFLYSECN